MHPAPVIQIGHPGRNQGGSRAADADPAADEKPRKEHRAVNRYSILEAARQLGRSKSTVKYWIRSLPPDTVSKDGSGRLWISAAGLDLLRARAAAAADRPDEDPALTGQKLDEPDEDPALTGRKPDEPDENPALTGRKLDENPPLTGRKPDEDPPLTGRKLDEDPHTAAAAAQLEALRIQLDQMRGELSAERQRAAVAAAERDAERRRADAAELREREQAATVTALTAALQTAQQQAADLTAALTAAQALHAGTIQERLAVSDAGEPAETADTDPERPQRRGLFAWIFGRK